MARRASHMDVAESAQEAECTRQYMSMRSDVASIGSLEAAVVKSQAMDGRSDAPHPREIKSCTTAP